MMVRLQTSEGVSPNFGGGASELRTPSPLQTSEGVSFPSTPGTSAADKDLCRAGTTPLPIPLRLTHEGF